MCSQKKREKKQLLERTQTRISSNKLFILIIILMTKLWSQPSASSSSHSKNYVPPHEMKAKHKWNPKNYLRNELAANAQFSDTLSQPQSSRLPIVDALCMLPSTTASSALSQYEFYPLFRVHIRTDRLLIADPPRSSFFSSCKC